MHIHMREHSAATRKDIHNLRKFYHWKSSITNNFWFRFPGQKQQQKYNTCTVKIDTTWRKQTGLVYHNHDTLKHYTHNYNNALMLTLTLPGPSAGVSGSLDSYCSLKPLCSGMGEVVPARTSPTLLPPSPRTVLSLSCFKVLQCINCRDWHCKS